MAGARCLVTGAWCPVPSYCCPVPGNWWPVPSDWCLVTGGRCLVNVPVLGERHSLPGAWCQVTGAWCLVIVTHYPVPGAQWKRLPNAWWLVTGAWWLVPCTGGLISWMVCSSVELPPVWVLPKQKNHAGCCSHEESLKKCHQIALIGRCPSSSNTSMANQS